MSTLKISLTFLALAVNLASPSEYSGLLSRLYKKASNENRPLILVLDNSLNSRDEHNTPQHRHRAVKPIAPVEVEIDSNVPMKILDLLNQNRKPLKLENEQTALENKQKLGKTVNYDDLMRLKLRLEKEKRDRKERRQRIEKRKKILSNLLERLDVGDIDIDRHHDRKERNQNGFRVKQHDRNQGGKKENRALRSSVIKNLLRFSNDLRCDAKDECKDECNADSGDGCEDECEVKYECDEPEKEKDPCDDNSDGGCADSEEVRSTRGERLVTVTAKCTRC